METRQRSRKIIFLNPHGTVSEQLVKLLIRTEFEAAILTDADKARTVLTRFPGSLLFINIEFAPGADYWQTWVTQLRTDPATADTRIGVFTDFPNRDLAETWLMDIGVPCGYYFLKAGIAENSSLMLDCLERLKARGDRRYLRANVSADISEATVSTENQNGTAKLEDLSVVACAMRFDGHLPPGTTINSLEFNIKDKSLNLSAEVLGHRTLKDGSQAHILLFNEMSGRRWREHIHDWLMDNIQKSITN